MSLAHKAALLICAAFPLLAAPTLTTIQDTIYKADGTKFSGTAVITWLPFDASDSSKIGLQSLTVQIINGSIRVQLVPNSNATPVNNYTVQYESGGSAQFTESWSVPPSTTTLRIKDVRVATTTGGASGGGVASPPSSDNPIAESAVTGLLTDLSLRPIKGNDYGPGRTAMVDSAGALNTVDGNLTDCVRVDGTSTSCFDSSMLPAFVNGETPGGVVDGSNATFTLAATPNPATSLLLYRNGLLLQAGSDFTIQTNGSIRFVAAAIPQPGDILTAGYQTSGSGSSASVTTQITPSGFTAAVAQVLCSSTGSLTSGATPDSLGDCTIPASLLTSGDRVDVRFTFTHTGTTSGFVFRLLWGGTTLLQRTASNLDTAVAGKTDVAIGMGGATFSGQSWGSALPIASTLGTATDALNIPLKIDFQAQMVSAGQGNVQLQNYTILRYPAH